MSTEKFSGAVWKSAEVEILGPFALTPSGNRFVICATDEHTNWIEAESMSDNVNAKNIARFLLQNISRLGLCKYLFVNILPQLSDEIVEEMKVLGKGFVEDDTLWEKLLEVSSDDDNGSSEDRPALHLRRKILDDKSDWDDNLNGILFEMRTVCGRKTVGETPFQLMYGRSHHYVSGYVNGRDSSSEVKKQKRKSGRPRKINLKEVVFEGDRTGVAERRAIRGKLLSRTTNTTNRQPYGLRTYLRSAARSSVVSRMLTKSRLTRSVLSDENGSGTSPGKHKIKVSAAVSSSKKVKRKSEISPDETSTVETDPSAVLDAIENESNYSDDRTSSDEDVSTNDPSYKEDDGVENVNEVGGSEVKDGKKNCKKNVAKVVRVKKVKAERNIKLEELSEEQLAEIQGFEPIVCQLCPEGRASFISESVRDIHMLFHKEGSDKLRCPHCELEEEFWSDMQLHLVSHCEVPIALTLPIECFTCRGCSKVLGSIDAVERHLHVFHRNRPVGVCEVCGKLFRYHRRYVAHIGVHSGLEHACNNCTFRARSFCTLAEHQIIHQGAGVACPVCERLFPTDFHMKDHQKNHSKKAKINICEFCGKMFNGTCAVKHHIKYIHCDTQQYVCKLCGYVGKTKSNLQGHTKRVHAKPFKCPKCDYACLSESTLQKHVDMFHNQEGRNHPCTLCPYRGRDAKTLAEHFRIRHKVTEGFTCPTCNVVFKTRTLLRDHMPMHTGARAFSCNLCDYTAKYRPTMYRHVKNKHPGHTLSSATCVAGRESTPRANVGRPNRRSKGTMTKKVKELMVLVEPEYPFQECGDHTTEEVDDENRDAINSIADHNMVAIMDSNLLSEMAASGHVCIQYIDNVVDSVGSMETVDDTKEKYHALNATELTFSCL